MRTRARVLIGLVNSMHKRAQSDWFVEQDVVFVRRAPLRVQFLVGLRLYSPFCAYTADSTTADWRVNNSQGDYHFGGVLMQNKYQNLASYATTGSFSASAIENRVSYNATRSICVKFITTGNSQA